MSNSDPMRELKSILVQSREVSGRLLERLDHHPDMIEVVGLLESLSLSDERRAHVLDRLRHEASSVRKREEERSVRQFVLRALERIGTPQTTGFLEDYLYATELVEAKSRGMGALRRDEYRAWARLRDRPRVAYVTPCLDEERSPVPRWMSRSDWPLEWRLVVDGAEELWAAHRVLALTDAFRDSDPDSEALFLPLIGRYAQEALGDDVSPEVPESTSAVDAIVRAVRGRTSELEPRVARAQERLATRFTDADELQRFWGIEK
jgi:hypothetical protein